ncbi:MAG: hypothetical protein ACYC9M_16350, partial [Desulfobulbaceae bacterium]
MRKKKRSDTSGRTTEPRSAPAPENGPDACGRFRTHYGHYFLLLLLAVLLATCYQILKPYLHTIVMAAILAALFHPI